MKPMSERQSCANRIARFINANKLTNPFGGDVVLDRSGKMPCYEVSFSKPRVLNGTVSVYSTSFIMVHFETSYRALPNRARHVYASEADAINFLKLAFVDLNFDEAMEIPLKGK
jgi:hypothetical protein